MSKHEVQSLNGELLDLAIAKLFHVELQGGYKLNWQSQLTEWHPSADWNQGGPLLHSNGVATAQTPQDKTVWRATVDTYVAHGPTALVAGLRVLLLRSYGTFVTLE